MLQFHTMMVVSDLSILNECSQVLGWAMAMGERDGMLWWGFGYA